MAYHSKIITAVGPEKLETELNAWLNENQEVKITSISHAFVESHIATNMGAIMERVFTFTALIVYQKENTIEI